MVKTCAVALALLLAWLGMPALAGCDAGERKMRFSVVVALQGHPKGEAALALADRVNESFDGRLCMEVYGNSELFNDDDIFPALLAGEAEMAAPSLSKFGGVTGALQVFDLPFLFDGPLTVMDFQNAPEGQDLKQSVEPAGFTGIAFLTNGMKQMSATRSLVLPQDAAGLRFRTQPSAVIEAQFEALEATPVPMAFSRVYGALESGEVEGQENTWSNIYTQRFHTVQDGVTETNHAYLGYLIIVSSAFLESLEPAVREELLLLTELTAHEYNRFAFEINALNRKSIMDEGTPVVSLSEAQRAAWKEAFEPVWREFAEQIGSEIIEAALAFSGIREPS